MTDSRLESWSRVVTGYPRRMAALGVILGVVFIYSIIGIEFENDLRTAIPTPSGKVLDRIDSAFGMREQSFVLVESADENAQGLLVRVAQALATRLQSEELIANVEYGYENLRTTVLEKLAPYGPRLALSANAPEIQNLFSDADLDERLERQIARLSLPGFGDSEALVLADPLDLGAFLWDRLATTRGAYRVDTGSAHTISEGGRAILIRVRGALPLEDLGAARKTALVISKTVQEIAQQFKESEDTALTFRTGGGHFLALESERIVRRDLIVSLSLSMVLVLALVGWTLRSARAGFLIFPPLTLGLLSGAGVLGLLKSHVTLLAFGSASILIGLGVDFAVHLLLRARAERAAGQDSGESVARAVRSSGPGLVFAALTTMGAFAAFHVSRFEFLEDMGSLAVFGIFGTLLATLSILPPLLAQWLSSKGVERPPRSLGVDSIVNVSTRHPMPVLIVALCLCVGAVATLVTSPPEMETDLRRIHARESAALETEARIKDIFGGEQEPLLLLLENEDGSESSRTLESGLSRLRMELDALVRSGQLVSYHSAALLLPDPAVEQAVQALFQPSDADSLQQRIVAALERNGFDSRALADAVDRVVRAATDPLPLDIERLRALGLGDWLATTVRNDPENPANTLALATLYPARDLWHEETRKDTLAAIRGALKQSGVHAQVASMITMSTETGLLVGREMVTIGGLSLLVAVALVVLLFRSPRDTLLVLLPVTLGCLWTALAFRLLDFRLHFMNASVLPMIIGIGIDDGIHLVQRYRYLRARFNGRPRNLVRETFSVTGTGVALTSLTTMIAFGSLGFSENRGLASIGILAFIGVGSCLLASVSVLPALMAGLVRSSNEPHRY